MRRIAVLDAPSNLGLRPPTPTSVPGSAKAPGALRDHGLVTRLGARDAGCLTPPRYDPGDWRPGDGVAHAAEIAAYSRALADRIGAIIDGGEFPVVLGGDCSVLLGSGVAMHRLGEAIGGRIGLVFVDGHSDFRHPGNASYVGAAAGEDLALVTGRGQADLAAIEQRRPYFRDVDVVVLGIRAQDEYRLDLQAAGIVTRPVPALRAEGAARTAQWARDQLVDCAGYWVHIDVDVLDPAVMPAVDAPEPGGIAFPELELLLAGLVETPHCLGVEITVFDPDYDPDGRYAAEIVSTVVGGLSAVRNTAPRPDLVAARRENAGGAPAVGRGAARADVGPPPAEVRRLVVVGSGAKPFAEPPADEVAGSWDDAGPVEQAGPLGGVGGALTGVAAGGEPSDDADDEPDVRPEDPERHGEPVSGSDGAGEHGAPAAWASGAQECGEVAGWAIGVDERHSSAEPSGAIRWAEPWVGVESSANVESPAGFAEGDGSAALSDDAEVGDGSAAPSDDVEVGDGSAAPPDDDEVAASSEGAGPGGSVRITAAPRPADGVPAEARLLPRPLGSAPLLDSEPLPATRPGMLRPRPPMDPPASGSLGTPARPSGSGMPADIT